MRLVGQECNGIVILESLSAGERPTAERLEATLRQAVEGNPLWKGLLVRRRVIGSREDLLAELAAMRDACINGQPYPLRPIVHLEMHGSEQGVFLQPSQELLPWRGVYDALVAVNRATRGQLQVSLGVCFGAYIIDLINPPDPAPFWGALGPTEPVWDSTVEKFFARYFEGLLEACDGTEALRRAGESFSGGAPAFQYFSGRQIFHGAYVRLLAESMSEAGLDRIVDEALRNRDPRDPHAHLDVGRRLRAKSLLMPQLERNFRTEREQFFMTGYDDDGTHRSGVEWENVLEDALALGPVD